MGAAVTVPMNHPTHRPPNWRWNRIVNLVDASERPSRKDDEYTTRGWRFLKRKRTCTERQLSSLEKAYPDIYYANYWYESETEYRWMLEASLCSDATIGQIAEDQNMGIREVKAFESLFFDVRGKLNSQTFVQTYILDPSFLNRTSESRSADWMPKIVALALGYEHLLDLKRVGNDSVILKKFMGIEWEKNVRWNGVEAARGQPLNRFTIMETLQLCQQMNAAADDSSRGAKEAMLDSVKELLSSVDFKKRKVSDKMLAPDGLEPRALQNSDIAFGEEEG